MYGGCSNITNTWSKQSKQDCSFAKSFSITAKGIDVLLAEFVQWQQNAQTAWIRQQVALQNVPFGNPVYK